MYLGAPNKLITDEGIRHMLRQARRFHIATLQDENLYVAAKHNAYAVAIVDKLLDLVSPEEVKAATGEDPLKLRTAILAEQDKHEAVAFKILDKLKAKGLKPERVTKEDLVKLIDRL